MDLGYRSDVDGLRAIAVLSVVVFHYGAALPPAWRLVGGFTGVDVFFVISGFLITQILRNEIVQGTFSVLGFYDRRLRRILPALIVMLAVTLIAGKFLLVPGDYRTLAVSAAGATFGASNFYFLAHTSYFDRASDLLPLLHTWSLAVEEQFYVVWPIALLFMVRGRRSFDSAGMIGVLVVIGFGASLAWFDFDAKAAFYMTPPRAWELAIGALLVFLPKLPRIAGEAATVAGLAIICTGFVTIDETHFPGPIALLPCVGAALVIWARQARAYSAQWLGFLSPIGLISYSLYLWHWPVWVLYRIYINGGQPTGREAILLALISVTLATVSFWLVERPFRRARWPQSRTILAGLSASTVIFCASMYIDSSDGLPGRLPQGVYAMRSLDAMWQWPCKTEAIFKDRIPDCVMGEPWQATEKRFVLWGDSHALHFAPLFDVAGHRQGWAGALLAWCPAPLDNILTAYKNDEPQYAEHCVEQRRTAIAAIANDPKIETIFLVSSWSNFVRYSINANPGDMPDRLELFRGALDRLFTALAPLNRRIVVVGDVPQWNSDPVPCAIANATSLLRQRCAPERSHTTPEFVAKFQGPILQVIDQEAGKYPNVSVFRPTDAMCKGTVCIDRLDGEFLYRDVTHIRRNLTEKTRDDLVSLLQLDRLLPTE